MVKLSAISEALDSLYPWIRGTLMDIACGSHCHDVPMDQRSSPHIDPAVPIMLFSDLSINSDHPQPQLHWTEVKRSVNTWMWVVHLKEKP